MRIISISIVALLLAASAVLAQQDPNDPGLPDSIIIGSAHVDLGVTFASIPIYAVTDDSVGFFNLPITWQAPQGGVHGTSGTSYFPPVNIWMVFDSVVTSENYFRMFGIYNLTEDSLVPPLHTNELRAHIITLRFAIDPGTPSQLVTIDTTYDSIGGPFELGLIDGLTEFRPALQVGFISIGGVGVDEETGTPDHFELAQNYPNPFNSSTLIEFSLAKNEDVTLVIYDLLGRRVRILQTGWLAEGSYSVVWDGNDESGAVVSSGLYLYRINMAGNSETKRMTLLR